MQRVKLTGIKQDSRGATYYKLVRVDSADNVIDDEQALAFLEFDEQASAPAAPAANAVRLYAEDNGSGKTRIVAKFASGANVVLGTQA
jgi:predicted secreted protein